MQAQMLQLLKFHLEVLSFCSFYLLNDNIILKRNENNNKKYSKLICFCSQLTKIKKKKQQMFITYHNQHSAKVFYFNLFPIMDVKLHGTTA